MTSIVVFLKKQSAMSAVTIKNIAVIGGGLMGSGIVQVSAAAGLRVHLVDVKDDILKMAMVTIKKNVLR